MTENSRNDFKGVKNPLQTKPAGDFNTTQKNCSMKRLVFHIFKFCIIQPFIECIRNHFIFFVTFDVIQCRISVYFLETVQIHVHLLRKHCPFHPAEAVQCILFICFKDRQDRFTPSWNHRPVSGNGCFFTVTFWNRMHRRNQHIRFQNRSFVFTSFLYSYATVRCGRMPRHSWIRYNTSSHFNRQVQENASKICKEKMI